MCKKFSAFFIALTSCLYLCTASFVSLSSAHADERVWHKSITLVGKSKYAENFDHYDYVNPKAPKGGTINRTALGTYDSFNPFAPIGVPAAGLNYQGGLLWDNLMTKGLDEPAATHPLIAEAFTYPDDYSQTTYRLDPRAKWHDGKPITVEDVRWSMEQLKIHSAVFNRYFHNVTKIRIENEREITFIFDQKNNRELPLIIGDLPVLPKHWWEAIGPDGKKRDLSKSTLEPPLGSGPYKISKISAGSSIEWQRVKDYWAADLPVNVGRYNFDHYKYTYFKDENARWEAFKKGGHDDYRGENRAQRWAQEYTFPAVKEGRVRKAEFSSTSGYQIQMFYLNTRREIFQDRRVRKALVWALNFEQMNEKIFYNLYSRSSSYFGGTELSATGLPSAQELEILEPYRGQIPDEVFTTEYQLPAYKTRRDTRKHLKTAINLLEAAGWVRKGTRLVNTKTGKPFTLEFLTNNPASERVYAPWLNSLKKMGIDAKLRVVDTSQYKRRLDNFDYDVVSVASGQSVSPGNEQRSYWTTHAANQPGSDNHAGIQNKAIDDLVEKLVFAKDRKTLVMTTRALERILQFEYYAVPAWTNAQTWLAFWDKIVVPDKQPEYYGIDPYSWWANPQKTQENN